MLKPKQIRELRENCGCAEMGSCVATAGFDDMDMRLKLQALIGQAGQLAQSMGLDYCREALEIAAERAVKEGR